MQSKKRLQLLPLRIVSGGFVRAIMCNNLLDGYSTDNCGLMVLQVEKGEFECKILVEYFCGLGEGYLSLR